MLSLAFWIENPWREACLWIAVASLPLILSYVYDALATQDGNRRLGERIRWIMDGIIGNTQKIKKKLGMRTLPRNWQVSCDKIRQRGRQILESDQWADCSFLVGPEENTSVIWAHTLILAMASPVFEAMLYGPWADRIKKIRVTDINPDVFRLLLSYIYTDYAYIENMYQAFELYYAAEKYMLKQLKDQCDTFIRTRLSSANACHSYEMAKLFGLKNVVANCLDIFRIYAVAVLQSPSFSEASISTILTIFDQPYIAMNSELDLIKALEKYVEVNNIIVPGSQQVAKMKGEPTIRDVVEKIRFLTLTAAEFAEHVSNSNLLTESETLAILLNICSRNSGVPLPEGFDRSRLNRAKGVAIDFYDFLRLSDQRKYFREITKRKFI